MSSTTTKVEEEEGDIVKIILKNVNQWKSDFYQQKCFNHSQLLPLDWWWVIYPKYSWSKNDFNNT